MDKLPDGINLNMTSMSLAQIAKNPGFPAYLRMAAMDIASDSYSTVGSILSNMCPQDLGSVLQSWLSLSEATREAANGEGIVKLASPSSFSYILFTMMVARAEAGEAKFDPLTAGLRAELMATFLQALILSNSFERVTVDLTKLTLSPEFLDCTFDHVLYTDNYKALQFVKDIKGIWKSMKGNEHLAPLMKSSAPKKEELIRAPATSSRFKAKPGQEWTSLLPKQGESSGPAKSVEDLEAKLRRLSDGG